MIDHTMSETEFREKFAGALANPLIRSALAPHEPQAQSARCSVATGSAFRFRLSAKYPPPSDSVGGIFVEGEIHCDAEDLPEAALALLKDIVASWDMDGQTHIEFTIAPSIGVTGNQDAEPIPASDLADMRDAGVLAATTVPGTKEYDEETELMQEAADAMRNFPMVSPNGRDEPRRSEA